MGLHGFSFRELQARPEKRSRPDTVSIALADWLRIAAARHAAAGTAATLSAGRASHLRCQTAPVLHEPVVLGVEGTASIRRARVASFIPGVVARASGHASEQEDENAEETVFHWLFPIPFKNAHTAGIFMTTKRVRMPAVRSRHPNIQRQVPPPNTRCITLF